MTEMPRPMVQYTPDAYIPVSEDGRQRMAHATPESLRGWLDFETERSRELSHEIGRCVAAMRYINSRLAVWREEDATLADLERAISAGEVTP